MAVEDLLMAEFAKQPNHRPDTINPPAVTVLQLLL